MKEKIENILNKLNKYLFKIYPYLGWIFFFCYFFHLLFIMFYVHEIKLLNLVLGPIDYLVDALLYTISFILGIISDIVFDDNLILNAKYTTLGDANATDIQTLIFSIEEQMQLISDNLVTFHDIIHSPEFIANLQTHGNATVAKFSVITFLIESTLSR